jgi:hypothetical protein
MMMKPANRSYETQIFWLFLTYSGFIIEIALYEKTPKNKKIAKMLIKEHAKAEHNYTKNYLELQAVERS